MARGVAEHGELFLSDVRMRIARRFFLMGCSPHPIPPGRYLEHVRDYAKEEVHPLIMRFIMQNPLAYLGTLFQEPSSEQPIDARIAKTFTKWDVAQMIMDDVHSELQEMPLNNAEDWPRFQRTLVDYAAYSTYAALMKRQLDQLMPGAEDKDYQAIQHKCYGRSPLRDVLKEAVNRDMDTEIAPLKKQFHTALAVSPGSWVERIQQSKATPQLVKDDAVLDGMCRIE